MRFVDAKDNSEKSENEDKDNENMVKLAASDSDDHEMEQLRKQNISDSMNFNQDIDKYFDEGFDENLFTSVTAQNQTGLGKKFSDRKSLRLSDRMNESVIDGESPQASKRLSSLREIQKQVPMVGLPEEEVALYHKIPVNSSLRLNIGASKLNKLGSNVVSGSISNAAKNANSGSSLQAIVSNPVRGTEIPTTCQVIFTCKTENKDICNTTEREPSYKCAPQSEPLKTVVDQVVLADYKLAIIPVVCEKHIYRPGDIDYETFHDTPIWVVGLESNKTLMYGKEALNFLLNVRKNMSRVPFVYQAEN